MAEYLSEEDMNTGEYISRDEALKMFHRCCDNCTSSYNGVMCRACADAGAMDILIDIPAADVQPTNQWISVENQLPEIGESVLVAVVVNAKLNIPFRTDFTPEFRIGWLEDDGKWGLQFDSADNHEILYWQPLPELPKDGDAE